MVLTYRQNSIKHLVGSLRGKRTLFFPALGGRVQAVLTSDSPALVGSNITFVVNLVFPRCQKEDANGNIVYEKNCRNGKEGQLCSWSSAHNPKAHGIGHHPSHPPPQGHVLFK